MRESRDQLKCVENVFGSRAHVLESEVNEVGSLVWLLRLNRLHTSSSNLTSGLHHYVCATFAAIVCDEDETIGKTKEETS